MKHIDSFDLYPGRIIGGAYVVERCLGAGWEGEVYEVAERRTGGRRAAKLFFPQRNERDRALSFYARKLEQLRDCSLLIKYHHTETIRYRNQRLTVLISEYVEGQLLEEMVSASRGRRLPEFEALHVLYTLVKGLEEVHARGEYHGDIHESNVLVKRRGVHYDVKLVDLLDLGAPRAGQIREDVVYCVHLLYYMLGGQPRYARQRPAVKWICCGLKRHLITKRFPTARHLREHLETFDWDG